MTSPSRSTQVGSLWGSVKSRIRTAWRVLKSDGLAALVGLGMRKYETLRMQTVVRYIDPGGGLKSPRVVQIEVSSNCNLRCPSCSLSREVNPGRSMSPSEFESILDRLPFIPPSVSLNGIGEPLVNPDFFKLVDILGRRSTKCSFSTNGTMLTDRIRKEILARENIGYVAISCDGAEKATFEALRFGAKFGVWKDSVKRFVRSARDRQPNPIITSMRCLLSRRNLPEVAGIIDLAAELRFPSLSFADIVRNDSAAADLALTDDEWRALDKGKMIRDGNQAGVRVSFNFRRESTPAKGRGKVRCFQPWEYAMVLAEGDVLPCCAVIGSARARVMGNILQQDFSEIWSGREFQEFRRTAARGTNDVCGLCPFY